MDTSHLMHSSIGQFSACEIVIPSAQGTAVNYVLLQ